MSSIFFDIDYDVHYHPEKYQINIHLAYGEKMANCNMGKLYQIP
jgi:hypothetical protein